MNPIYTKNVFTYHWPLTLALLHLSSAMLWLDGKLQISVISHFQHDCSFMSICSSSSVPTISWYCNYHEQTSFRVQVGTSSKPHSLGFRVAFLLMWLPNRARESSLLCYLIHTCGGGEEMGSYISQVQKCM